MYYRFNRPYNILKVDDDFASLKNISSDGSYEFEFFYNISQIDAVRKQSTKVEVTVFSKFTKKRPILTESVGKIDSGVLIDNVLTDMVAAKNAIKYQDENIIKTKISDVTSVINNEIYGPLLQGVSPQNIQELYGTVIKTVSAGDIKSNNDIKPVIHLLNLKVDNVPTAVSSSVELDYQSLVNDMIMREGIDPSYVTELSNKVIFADQSRQGLLPVPTRSTIKESNLQQIYDYIILNNGISTEKQNTSNAVDSNKKLQVISTELIDMVRIPVRITLPKLSFSTLSSNVYVRFRLIDPRSGSMLDEIVKQLNIQQHVSIMNTPMIAPVVKQIKSNLSSRVNLSITQQDQRANGFYVYKKALFRSVVDIDKYSLISRYDLQYRKNIVIQVDKPLYDASIYRIVPVYQGNIGSTYTNVVVVPQKYRPRNSISLTSKISSNGVAIEVSKLPTSTTAVQVMQRNLTIHENTYTPISTPILIDSSIKKLDQIVVNAQNVQNNNVYEFCAKLYHDDGTIEHAATVDTLEYVTQTPGKVDIAITNVKVTHDNHPNVSFKVDVNILDNNIDVVKALMEKQGIKTYFDNDISKQRDQLKHLMAYSIHRIDLTTGEREDLGVITNFNFDDDLVRKNYATKPLQYGHKYRYVVSALARSPETVLNDLTKTVTDPVSKKQYTYNPAKFHHPIALTRGIIVSEAGLRTKYSKTIFEHGILGTSNEVEISFDNEKIRIIDASVSKFDMYTCVIKWRVSGDISNVDHFLVMKEIHGTRSIIGIAHSEFIAGNCYWHHHLTPQDHGEITYLITPIMNDYVIGSTMSTNSIIIEG